MTIVAGLFASVFGRLLRRRKGIMTAVVGNGVYTVLVGRMRQWCGQPSWVGYPCSPAR